MIHEPLHPGVILKDVFIDGTDLSISKAAEHLGDIIPFIKSACGH